MSDVIKIRVLGCIPPYKPGDVVVVEADENGTSLDLHWRRRCRDAEIDGCCEVVVDHEDRDAVVQTRDADEEYEA